MIEYKRKYSFEEPLPFCCVPACIRTIFNRRGIAGQDQEGIGKSLGLVVPSEYRSYFSEDHTGEMPDTGWGTRVHLPEFSFHKFLESYDLSFSHEPRYTLGQIKASLRRGEDIMLCIGNGASGHLILLDGFGKGIVSYLDGDSESYVEEMAYLRSLFRSPDQMGGIWRIF